MVLTWSDCLDYLRGSCVITKVLIQETEGSKAREARVASRPCGGRGRAAQAVVSRKLSPACMGVVLALCSLSKAVYWRRGEDEETSTKEDSFLKTCQRAQLGQVGANVDGSQGQRLEFAVQ